MPKIVKTSLSVEESLPVEDFLIPLVSIEDSVPMKSFGSALGDPGSSGRVSQS